MRRGRRNYEQAALGAVRDRRQVALFWARRCGKSTNLGAIAFDEMSNHRGRTVIAASASLLLGRELVGMTLSSIEQAAIVGQEAAAVQAVMATEAGAKGLRLEVAKANTNKLLAGMTPGDFAGLYHSSNMELRLYFESNSYSRLKIIAPNPATARGWGGTVLRDEAAFVPAAMEHELRTATKPIMDTDPTFKLIYASNLCADDRHPFFEMTMPPPDKQFPPNDTGHFYDGQNGVLIHRVTLADAYAAGHVLYDDHGEPLTLETFRAKPGNRLGAAMNYDLIHEAGGAAAIDLMALLTAQRRGAEECAFFMAEDEAGCQWQRACERLRELLKAGRVGIGFDVASTTSETSNPSSITVTEMSGAERKQRLVCIFKSKKRALMVERLRDICRIVRGRPAGGPAVRLCIDASNERLAAEEIRDDLRGVVPVELVVAGSAIHPPGYREATNYKAYLNDLYSAAINDNRYALPAAEYIKLDHRLTVKDQGRYKCQVDADGRHGDTFDSGKQAEWALASRGQTCRVAIAAQVGGYESGGAFF